jgi:hypothetical protein
MNKEDYRAILDAAEHVWRKAKPRQRIVRFEFRGVKYKSHISQFRMFVDTAAGQAVACRYL